MSKNTQTKSMFARKQIVVATGLAVSLMAAHAAYAQQAPEKTQVVEITGSRLKRADIEGSVPVTVIDRAAIEASGETSVAELLREVTFSSFGNTKPQSGSSGQALADIDLRGLGSNRTLVLIDGRRAPKAPFSGSAQDLNALPLAAVERIEILSDGASAVYGSEAIGGVVNIITRKNFNGFQATYGEGNPKIVGGDTREASILYGASSDKGRMFAGISSNSRGMVFTRDQIGYTLGVSSFANGIQVANAAGTPATGAFGTGARTTYPGFACNEGAFYITGTGSCSFDFNSVAANEASVDNKSVFANGEFNINDDWKAYSSASLNLVKTFGRYAPTPGTVFIASDSPGDPTGGANFPGSVSNGRGAFVRHRFAAGGNRDTNTDANVIDGLFGFKGRLFDKVDVDFGVRKNKYTYNEFGTGYVVGTLAEAAIANGSYNLANPFGNCAAALTPAQCTAFKAANQTAINSFLAVITRRDLWDTTERYASAAFDITKIDGRPVAAIVGYETRSEYYADLYDSLSEAGVILGSAGNSAAGGRKVKSAFFEVGIPVLKNLDVTVAGRKDKYSDAGGRFSPKVSAAWQPMKNLKLRSSWGEGFNAPSLDLLTQKPAFSADSVIDPATFIFFGGAIAKAETTAVQVDSTVVSNPGLKPETSVQKSFGIVYDPTDWLSLTTDIYKIAIENRITAMSAQTVINRTINPALGPVPAALGVTRDTTVVVAGVPVATPAYPVNPVLRVVRGSVNEGNVDVTGIDFNAKFDFKMSSFGRLQSQLQVSLVDKYSLNKGRNLIGDQGVPKYRMNILNTWSKDRFGANLNYIYIAKQPDTLGTLPTAAYGTIDVSLVYKHPSKTTITIGANNVTDKYPELLGYDGRPWNFGLYDAYGRQVYFRVQQAF